MRRRIIVTLLALGTLGGYASGFSSLRHRSHCRHAWMEERSVQAPAPPSAEPPTPPGPR